MKFLRFVIYGVYLIIFCLPLYLVRFKVFGIPTTVLELMIYALLVLWLFFGGPKELKQALKGNKSLVFGSILLLVGISLATIFSSDLRISAGIWKGWFLDPILFFIIFISAIKTIREAKMALGSLFFSGVVVSIISLIYLLFNKLDASGRLQAFYNSPNYLAMYLAPALIIGLFFLFFKNPKKQYFIFFAVIILLVVLIFTKSYGAWLGILAAAGIFSCVYFYKAQKGGKKTFFLILFIFLAIISAFCFFVINQRQASFDARLIIWQKSLEIFKDNPVLGIGPGTFGDYLQPHNIFLAFLLQTGIIGFIGFILILIWFFRPKADHPQGGNLLMMLMAYILAHGLVDTTYWKNDLAIIFWLVAGLMVILKKNPEK